MLQATEGRELVGIPSRCPPHVCLIWQGASRRMFLQCYLVSARDVKRRELLPETRENAESFPKEGKLRLPDPIISPVLASSLSEKLLLIGTACLDVLLPDDCGGGACWYKSQQVFAFQWWWLGGEREKNHNFVGTGVWAGDAVCRKILNFCVALSPPLREKDKHKTWMPKFLTAKEEKDQRKSSDDVERS